MITALIIANCIISIIAVIVTSVFLFGDGKGPKDEDKSMVLIVYMMAMFPIMNIIILWVIGMVCLEDKE